MTCQMEKMEEESFAMKKKMEEEKNGLSGENI